MKPERWQRLQELFEAVADLGAAERDSYLERHCADDPELRREVESLIASDGKAGGFIEGAIRDVAGSVQQAADGDRRHVRIGPYRVLHEIGRGGMGTVYLASRADDQYRKHVAIKLMRSGLDDREQVLRFRSERQILATLDHTNIARLLDGGTTEDGAPYVVMEYVKGQPIDEYCDRNRLTTAERLTLFLSVCSAVHYAHSNLVVHRDLKPSNILVTADGTPKLLDFGIAKLLNPELAPQTVAVTHTAMRLLTPEYASPEQVRGEPIGTASDVYSLGVLLYELLTGSRPHRLQTRTPREIERAICEVEPDRPSTAVSRPLEVGPDRRRPVTAETIGHARRTAPDKLRRQLTGDLDNIVLLALRKEPSRRYSSVEHLAGDIRRFLDGLPVSARPDTWRYRTGKFVRRHALAVGAAASFVILLAGFGATMAIQAARVARQRDVASLEREKAQQVSAFLIDLFQVADPDESRGDEITAREILDEGARKVEAELRGQPEVQATMMDTMGRVYWSLGLYDKARALLQQGLDQRRRLLGDENADVASSMSGLASVLRAQGEYDEAERLYRQALVTDRRLFGDEHPEVATALHNLAVVLENRGEYDEAERLHREALAMRRELLGDDDKDVASSMMNLALVLQSRGEYDEALSLMQNAVKIERRLLGGDHPDVARDLNNLAALVWEVGDYDAAGNYLREALAIERKVYGEEHHGLATTLNNLAALLYTQGDFAGAEPLFRQSLKLDRKYLGAEHPDVATDLHNLGRVREALGDDASAESFLRQAMDMRRRTLGAEHRLTASSMTSLSGVLLRRGAFDEAQSLLLQALEVQREALGNEHPSVVNTLVNLGNLARRRADLDEAERRFRDAADLARRAYPEDHPRIARPLVGLGGVLMDRGDPSAAEPALREAVEILRGGYPEGHWETGDAELKLGACLGRLGRFGEAEPLMLQGYAAVVENRGEGDERAVAGRRRLVEFYESWDKPAKADAYRDDPAGVGGP